MAPAEHQRPSANSSQRTVNLALASVAALGGCLVLAVVVIALFSGLWLDGVLNTKPLFTLVLVIGSVPLGIYIMYRVAMGVINRSLTQPQASTSTQGEKQP
jgi:F0F1-type ATP synthase assembly protein I